MFYISSLFKNEAFKTQTLVLIACSWTHAVNFFEMFVCDSDVFLRVDIFTHQPPLLRCYLISTFLNWCLIQLLKRDESIIIHIDVVKIIDQLLIRRLASAGLSLWVCVVQFFVCFDISFKKLYLRVESSYSKRVIGKWETYSSYRTTYHFAF